MEKYINESLELVAQSLRSILADAQISADLIARGKRYRTQFMLSMLLSQSKVVDLQVCVKYATAIELIHEASLIIDDIVDQSIMRRGEPSFYVKHGIAKSILTANYYLLKSTRIILDSKDLTGNFELCLNMLNSIEEMVLSELRNCEIESSKETVGLEELWDEYFQTIRKKTAVLFEMAGILTAVQLGQSANQMIKTRNISIEFGILFQLRDDILDYYANCSLLGKMPLSDNKKSKITLPALILMSRNQHLLDDRSLLFEKAANREDFELVISYYNEKFNSFIQTFEQFAKNNTENSIAILKNILCLPL